MVVLRVYFENKMPRAGIEPATFPLGGGRAIRCATEAKDDCKVYDDELLGLWGR